MYDLAKRSLAFTVATGGLLLTGTAYSPALAAVGVGANQGPAQAQGVQSDASNSSSPVTTAGSPGGVEAPPDLLAPSALNPNVPAPRPRAASSGPGATANSNTNRSGGIASGNNIQIPINLGLNLCGNHVKGLSANDVSGGGNCTNPSGSSANGTTSHSGGILSGNIIQAPVNVPVNACGNNVNGAVVSSTESGSACTNSAEGSAPTTPGSPAPGSG